MDSLDAMGAVLSEVPVQIPQRHPEGWLFLAFCFLIPLLFLELFIGPVGVRWILSIGIGFLFLYFLRKIVDTQLKSGPARSWFRRGMLNAWISLDGEDLIVRTVWKGQEAYKPSRIEWATPQAFTVKEGDTSFDLVFQNTDEATKFAARMKANIPKILESSLP